MGTGTAPRLTMGDLGGITGTEIQAKYIGAGEKCHEVMIEPKKLSAERHQDQLRGCTGDGGS
jgi:hypothetical protein